MGCVMTVSQLSIWTCFEW